MTDANDNISFERVYTMTDDYDGPRRGIASFRGKPHAYTCPFDFSGTMPTAPVSQARTHIPPYRTIRARHTITPVLAARLDALLGPAIRARGDFRATPGRDNAGGGRWMEVRRTVEES